MPSKLDIQTLRLFCHLAVGRSFSRTAEEHGLTQSAVSQRIRQLESRLGTRLLDRSVRPFMLTATGELLARESRPIVDGFDDLVRRVRELETQSERPVLRGEVRIDAIFSAGIGLLRSLTSDFTASHPEVSVELEYKRPEEVADAVRGGLCDFGIVSYPKSSRDVQVRALRDERMCVVCGPSHPLAENRRVGAKELGRWSMVGFDPTLPVARGIRRFLRANDVLPRYSNLVDNIDTMKMMVEETDQIAIIPQRTVLREVEGGSLRALELEPPLMRPLAIIQPRRRQLRAAARALADYLLEHAGPLPDTASPVTLGSRPPGTTSRGTTGQSLRVAS